MLIAVTEVAILIQILKDLKQLKHIIKFKNDV